MSSRLPLSDYKNSRAVLMGTSTYRELSPVPAAVNSLQRMIGLLTSDLCGWPLGRITAIRDEAGPGDLHHRLIRLFREVTDVALFYFVGHGQVDDKDQLCLGLTGSSEEPDLRASTSLEFQDVRDALIRSPASTKILILDCCFSGLASERRNTLGVSHLADQVGGAGAYAMAACQSYGMASFETGSSKPQTYFTKYLVDVIETGIPGEPAGLQLRPIFKQLSAMLEADGHPQPVERNVNSASEFVLAYNAAPVQVQIDVKTAIEQMGARIAQLEASLVASPGSDVPNQSSAPGPAVGHGPDVTSGQEFAGSDEQSGPIAHLQKRAANLLRLNRGEDFRAIEAQLEELGSSARPTAVLQTSLGPIAIRLFPDYTPEAVRNFIELAKGRRVWLDPRQREPVRRGARLYDGTLFRPVIRGLLIQGGDPVGTGHGGPGYHQAHELHRDLTFDRPYLVARASSGPNSDGSQFFITVVPAPWLTNKHTIFGTVIGGTDVVDRINDVPVDSSDRPIEDVVLETVDISEPTTGPS